MGNEIFRKKSIDRISSPEQMDDYIRVTTPGVWMILVGIILMLVGVVIWGMIGHLTSTVDVVCQVDEEKAVCYVDDNMRKKLKTGMTVMIGDESYLIESIEEEPQQIDLSSDAGAYIGYTLGSDDSFIYSFSIDRKPEELGLYRGKVVVETLKPLYFITN